MDAANDDFRGPIPARSMLAHTRQAGVGLAYTRLRRVGEKVWQTARRCASDAADHAGDVFVISAGALLLVAAGWL